MLELSLQAFSKEPDIWDHEHFTAHFQLADFDRVPVYLGESEEFLKLLSNSSGALRTCLPAHFTTSSVVFHPYQDAVLLVFHKKYQEWIYPGGHADGDWLWVRSALRECVEETGIESVNVIPSPAAPRRTLLPSLPIPLPYLIPHHVERFSVPEVKGEHPFPAHFHFDIVYLFQALSVEVKHDPRESGGIRWVAGDVFRDHLKSGDEKREGVHIYTAEIYARAQAAKIDALRNE